VERFFYHARTGGCVIIHNMVLRGTIFRAKALAYTDKTMIMYSFFLSICFPGHVAQGFNPAKANCDTTAQG